MSLGNVDQSTKISRILRMSSFWLTSIFYHIGFSQTFRQMNVSVLWDRSTWSHNANSRNRNDSFEILVLQMHSYVWLRHTHEYETHNELTRPMGALLRIFLLYCHSPLSFFLTGSPAALSIDTMDRIVRRKSHFTYRIIPKVWIFEDSAIEIRKYFHVDDLS